MDMIKIEPVGGQTGTIWDEKGRDQVGGVLVFYSERGIRSLQFMFYENGKLVLSNKHGDSEYDEFCCIVFDYPSEFLTSIIASSGPLSMYSSSKILKTIKFVTNKCSYGPFETSSHVRNIYFHLGMKGCFGGFHGTYCWDGIESIGIYVKTNYTINPKVIPSVKSEKEDD